VFSTLVELVGICLIVAAAYLVALPLALLVAGVWLMTVANVYDIRGRRSKDSKQ
jgi:hypothetical protein